MVKKVYTCKQCGDYLSGQRRKFCSDECSREWEYEQHRMDFGTGNCHNDPVTYEQRHYTGSLETKSIPAEILQKIEDMNFFNYDYNFTSYEDPEVVKIAIRSLNRNTPEHIKKDLYNRMIKKNYREKHGMTREYPIPTD